MAGELMGHRVETTIPFLLNGHKYQTMSYLYTHFLMQKLING